MSNSITIADVAREAGVSAMTVSRVVNRKGEVSPDTIRRVQEVIERLGYRPSGIARGLATRRTGTLGLVIPDIANPFFSGLARGVEQAAYEAGYNVFLCNTDEDPQREVEVLQSLEEKRVDGVLLCSSRLGESELVAALERFPAGVLVNRRLERKLFGAVVVDDELGGALATRHLLQTGHREIGFLAGPAVSYSGQERAKGYRAALEAAGRSYDPGLVYPCQPTLDGGKQTAARLLVDHPGVTALFCFNDLVAAGALHACIEMGRGVPADLAIVGCDDIPLARLIVPPLTTCRVPLSEMGVQATRLLLERMRGCEDCTEVVLKPELVVRASAPAEGYVDDRR